MFAAQQLGGTSDCFLREVRSRVLRAEISRYYAGLSGTNYNRTRSAGNGCSTL